MGVNSPFNIKEYKMAYKNHSGKELKGLYNGIKKCLETIKMTKEQNLALINELKLIEKEIEKRGIEKC